MPYEEAFYIPKKTKSTHQGFVRKGEQRNRPRAPEPGQGTVRVTNPDVAWLPSDPRHSSRATAPKPSRFASVIGEEVTRRAAPSPIAGAQSSDPLFGAPLFSRPPESSPIVGPHGPFPAGPRREATPYSGGRRAATPYSGGPSAGLEQPRENEAEQRHAEAIRLHSPNPPSFPTNLSPAEEWFWSPNRPRDGRGDALSDYYAQQADEGRRQAAAQAEAQRLARERMEAAIFREGMLEDYRRERERRFGAK